MNYTDFNALPVIAPSGVGLLTAGDYFLFPGQEKQKGDYGANKSQRGEGTELRHKVHYQRKVDPIDAYGITGPDVGYVSEYDLLESDPTTNETRSGVRLGKNKLDDSAPGATGDNYQDGPNASRDDDAAHDVINQGGKWVI